MSIAEGVSGRIAFKAYSSGAITAGSEPSTATDPGATGGQILRRVGSTLSLGKDTYQSAEVRSDRQIADFRHGTKRVQGNVSGELSPLTYEEFFEAVTRGTWDVAGLTKTEVQMTSMAADATASTFTCGGSTWAAEGFKVGDTIRFTDLATAANNSKNFTIVSLADTVATVTPAPTTMTADTAFTVTRPGGKLVVPSSGHVSRKFAVEIWNQDIDVARLFTELRVGSARVNLPATGMSTVEFGFLGRNMVVLDGASAPYFTGPTAATATGICAAVNGALVLNSGASAVVTGVDFSIDLSPSADPVVGSNLVPEIFLGRFNATGNINAFFQSKTEMELFLNETEANLILRLDATSAADSPFVGFTFPRIKLGDANVQTSGEGGQTVSMPFQALLKATATGYDATTFWMQDSEVTS